LKTREETRMVEVRNLDAKRVCDISENGKEIVIRKKDCLTIIHAADDGTLKISHLRISA